MTTKKEKELRLDLDSFLGTLNPFFTEFLSSRERYLILYGGAGSGKSVFASQKIILRMLIGMFKGVKHNFLIVRKTYTSLKSSVFAELKQVVNDWGLSHMFEFKTSPLEIRLLDGYNPYSSIIFKGVDNPEKLKSISRVTGVFIEEATELTYEEYAQIDTRLRSSIFDNKGEEVYLQIVIAFNPISETHWIKKHFFDYKDNLRDKKHASKIGRNIKAVHSNYKDNPFLPQNVREVYESFKHTDINHYRVYTLGEWGNSTGNIFTRDVNYFISDEFPSAPTYQKVIYGLDFGFSNDPTAVVKVVFIGDFAYVEEVLYKKGLTNQELARELTSKKVPNTAMIYCDSAEPKSIEELRRAGFPYARKSDKSKLNGINYVKEVKPFIYADSKNLIDELSSYKFETDSKGRVTTQTGKYKNDHLIDSLRYALYTHHLHGNIKSNQSLYKRVEQYSIGDAIWQI